MKKNIDEAFFFYIFILLVIIFLIIILIKIYKAILKKNILEPYVSKGEDGQMYCNNIQHIDNSTDLHRQTFISYLAIIDNSYRWGGNLRIDYITSNNKNEIYGLAYEKLIIKKIHGERHWKLIYNGLIPNHDLPLKQIEYYNNDYNRWKNSPYLVAIDTKGELYFLDIQQAINDRETMHGIIVKEERTTWASKRTRWQKAFNDGEIKAKWNRYEPDWSNRTGPTETNIKQFVIHNHIMYIVLNDGVIKTRPMWTWQKWKEFNIWVEYRWWLRANYITIHKDTIYAIHRNDNNLFKIEVDTFLQDNEEREEEEEIEEGEEEEGAIQIQKHKGHLYGIKKINNTNKLCRIKLNMDNNLDKIPLEWEHDILKAFSKKEQDENYDIKQFIIHKNNIIFIKWHDNAHKHYIYPISEWCNAQRGCGNRWSNDIATCYIQRYGDLRNAFCTNPKDITTCDLDRARCHYVNWGKSQGRMYQCHPGKESFDNMVNTVRNNSRVDYKLISEL